MLTVKVITPKQGESYYAKENYYSAEESVENSRWMGKGAKKLGLKGKVKPKQFKKLLYGQLPNGTNFRRRKQERKGYKERAGLDCTFSAPKSVSILALVEGRKELEKAHRQAVLDTLRIIERNYTTTRVSKDGKVTTINTDNMVVGQFHHDTSRELDPHLHTHCVILNMTEHNDKWYSFRNDEIFANKKLLGTIYQNQLAIRVKKLGYEIEQKGHGQFEIKGFSQEQLESFSKRRQQIKSQLGEESTWKEREKIWDKTRAKKKESIPRDELQDYWRKEYQAQNVSYPQPNEGLGGRVSGVGERQHPTPNTPHPSSKVNINQAVAEAIEHCSERTVAFRAEDIQKFILTEVGKYSYKEIEKAIATSNELIHLDKQITTQSALLREIATIKIVKEGKDKVHSLSTFPEVERAIAGKNLTEGQKNAITLAATTGAQFIAWSGKAGVGKTYALNEFKQIAEQQGYVVKGFAPSAKAAKVLSEEMGIETTTVARKLVSKPLEEENEQQQIWIVDEAGLLGAKDAEELLKKAQAENARVLLVGDTRQLSSVAAGNPFKSLQNAGIATAYLEESLRQKTKDLKHAVNLLSNGKVAEGINVLETNNRILAIQDSAERANHIAQDYLKLTPEERKETLIIAGTHQEREAIINSIREGLKQEGSLGKEVKAFRLKSKNLTNVQKKYAHYYEEGNVIIPLSNYKKLGLEKGQQYQVKEVDGDSLVLLAQDGQEQRVSPTWFKHKEVYQAIETNIAVGDRLRWGKNDKQLNRINGGEFVVTKIDGETATIETETGKREQIELKTPQHLDHALVSTTYSSQGVTSKKVYVSVTNDLTLSQESFYVAASRAKYNLQLYVEDKAKLVGNAKTSRAQQNPLELIRAYKQKESAVETTLEKLESEKHSNYNQTVQQDHDRHQQPQSNSQRNYQRSDQPHPSTPRRDRKQPAQSPRRSGIESPRLKDRVAELSNGISSFVEQEETEQLAENLDSLNQRIRDSFGEHGRIRRLNRTITEYTRQHERQRGLDTIKDSIEESLLRSDPELLSTLKQLTQSLSAQSSNLQKLQNTIDTHTKQLKQQPTLVNTTEELAEAITAHSQQIEVEEIGEPVNRLTVQLQESTAIKTLHYSLMRRQIMQTLNRVNPAEQRILKLKTKSLSSQLQELETKKSQPSKRKQQEQRRDYLKKKLANIQAYTQLSVGQRVTVSEQIGTITELKLSPGGMPEAWVHWDNTPVPIPEQPQRLEVTTQKLNSSLPEQNEVQTTSQPESVKTERLKVISPPPASTEQSVKPNTKKARPLPRTSKSVVKPNVIRVDFNRREVNRQGKKEEFRELVARARNMPLEEVVQRLGLEPDKHDHHKYKSDAHIISITDQRFYDHLNQKGGGGALDLVMHVQDSSFKEAVDWLNGNSTNLTPIKQANSSFKQTPKPQPFEPPPPDESKWRAVKDYLVTTRGLTESIVDTLHELGKVYADSKQNAVFVRKNMEGEVTGASLRATYQDSQFKGLAKGTSRDAGWFALKKGQGELERIVLTESPIDAISAAAISQKKEATLFLSTDGAGSIPHQFLQQKLAEGKQVIVAYDNDEAGHTMAQQVLDKLPSAQRITPTIGKDWNEQLLHSQNSLEQKKQALRREYEGLKDRVRSASNFQQAEAEEIDIGIAMLVIKESVNKGRTDNLINRVAEVLSQSDQLKEWKQSMPEDEYRAKAQDYVVQTFEQASQIRENIRAERERNRDIELER